MRPFLWLFLFLVLSTSASAVTHDTAFICDTCQYSSTITAEAAEDAHLITADKIMHLVYKGNVAETLSADCVVTGWTTDESHYIEFSVMNDGNGKGKHNGTYDTTAAEVIRAVSGSNQEVFYNYENYVRFTGLQIIADSAWTSTQSPRLLRYDNDFLGTTYIDGCVLKMVGEGWSAATHPIDINGTGWSYISNNLIIGADTTLGSYAIALGALTAAGEATYIVNNTIVDFYNGILLPTDLNSDSIVVMNNIFFNVTYPFYTNHTIRNADVVANNYFTADTGELALETVPDVFENNHTGVSFAFVDSAGGDYHLSAGCIAIDSGAYGGRFMLRPIDTDDSDRVVRVYTDVEMTGIQKYAATTNFSTGTTNEAEHGNETPNTKIILLTPDVSSLSGKTLNRAFLRLTTAAAASEVPDYITRPVTTDFTQSFVTYDTAKVGQDWSSDMWTSSDFNGFEHYAADRSAIGDDLLWISDSADSLVQGLQTVIDGTAYGVGVWVSISGYTSTLRSENHDSLHQRPLMYVEYETTDDVGDAWDIGFDEFISTGEAAATPIIIWLHSPYGPGYIHSPSDTSGRHTP